MIPLYKHQISAIPLMRNGCILCGGVGTGKTRTALAYYYKEQGGDLNSDGIYMKNPKDLYIITTAKVRDDHNWEKDMIVFRMSTDKKLNNYNNNIVVDSWNNIVNYSDISGAFFIFDEQRVVSSGLWSKMCIKIAKKNDWIMLSATPGDTWSDYISIFIANNFFKNKTQFNREHVVFSPFTNYPKIERYINIERLIRLRDRILVNMEFNRNTVRHYIPVKVSYNRDIYNNIVKLRWNPYTEAPIKNASEYCKTLQKCIFSDPSRSDAVLNLNNEHKRIIIFYNYDYELDILRSLQYGKPVAEWNGHKHQEIPSSEEWVYLVQYNAGAEGWNCIKTDTIIFYSANYSYKILEQACGRIDRLNTAYIDLYYYQLESEANIDKRINHCIKIKKKFNESNYAKNSGGHYECKYRTTG